MAARRCRLLPSNSHSKQTVDDSQQGLEIAAVLPMFHASPHWRPVPVTPGDTRLER
jgi:hypothetical protein